jgi:demethylmenaquinone methyltransferase/2-methoxy-6-polyprenyl-1,4-benzoquinol methylase
MRAQQGAGAATGPSGGNGAGRDHEPPRRAPSLDAASGQLEAGQVRAMFDGIAGVYDLLNTAMTAGLHHRWRARAADLARLRPGSRALDVATGTGDLAIELARRVSPGGEIVGSDFAEAMLARARAKTETSTGAPAVRPRFEWGDALALPYDDDTFDAATVGFGARNFADLARGLAEMVRVVRPGGRVVVLEITTPTKPPLSYFYALWFDRLVPMLGRAAQRIARMLGERRGADRQDLPGAHDLPGVQNSPAAQDLPGEQVSIAQAYRYLPSSVRRFPRPAELAAQLERAGLGEIAYVLMAGGIVAIHAGTVPRGDGA